MVGITYFLWKSSPICLYLVLNYLWLHLFRWRRPATVSISTTWTRSWSTTKNSSSWETGGGSDQRPRDQELSWEEQSCILRGRIPQPLTITNLAKMRRQKASRRLFWAEISDGYKTTFNITINLPLNKPLVRLQSSVRLIRRSNTYQQFRKVVNINDIYGFQKSLELLHSDIRYHSIT